jgi:hypothetical protein
MGMDMGPIRGRPGEAVPTIAHAREWVVTPDQLAGLRRSPPPKAPAFSANVAAATIDHDRLGASVARTSSASVVRVGDVSRAQRGVKLSH